MRERLRYGSLLWLLRCEIPDGEGSSHAIEGLQCLGEELGDGLTGVWQGNEMTWAVYAHRDPLQATISDMISPYIGI